MPDSNLSDSERTRVIDASDEQPVTTATQVRVEPEPAPEKKPGLFDGLCLPQIIAGAAAASTSLALSSTLGIAGSLIGAAVSSVVSVVCSQLYRRALDAGSEKVKQGKDKLDAAAASAAQTAGVTTVLDSDASATSEVATTVLTGEDGPVDTTARIAPDSLLDRSDERDADRRASTQKKVIIFSIVLAALALAICAGAIMLGTHGEGLGEQTEIISLVSDETSDADTDASEDVKTSTSTETGESSAATESTDTEDSVESSSNDSSTVDEDGSHDSTSDDSADDASSDTSTDHASTADETEATDSDTAETDTNSPVTGDTGSSAD